MLRFFSADNAPAKRLPAPPIDAMAPCELHTATFAVGWFWTPDAQFGVVEGVWRTRVGYAGGERLDPTYHDIRDHTECFQVDFDPGVVSYEALLELALSSHDPFRAAFRDQYASLVLTDDAEQAATARRVAEKLELARGRKLATRIEPLKRFYLAEDYHQKYYLRGDRTLMADFRAMFADDSDFRESTAAARANGYAAGDGSSARLESEIGLLGLTEPAREHLARRIGRGGSRSGGGCAI